VEAASGAFASFSSLDAYTAGWILIGAGDVDGGGYDDLLWRNPTTCQFSYRLIKGGVHVETDTTAITCGYYPISIGYYTPSNRISIIWTNAAQDLQIWDSAGNQFTPYLFGIYGPRSTMITMGGGYESTPAPMPHTCPTFAIPSGWKVIGALANDIVPGG
jgi:hypothetical protein